MSEPNDGDDATPGEPGGTNDPRREEVGSVGDEAVKLLGALSEWARDSAGDVGGLGQSLGGLAGHAAAAASEINAHLDTGAPECSYCPVCRTVHVIRATSPEVKAHLVTAASSLLQAAAGLLATLPPPTTAPGSSAGGGSDFERIDLDDPDDGGPT